MGDPGMAVSSWDFHFDHPGTGSIADPRLRGKVLRTSFTFHPPIYASPAHRTGLNKGLRHALAPSLPTPLRPCLLATAMLAVPRFVSLPSRHWQHRQSVQHLAERPSVEVALG